MSNALQRVDRGPVYDQLLQLLARVQTIEQQVQTIQRQALQRIQSPSGQAISAGGYPIQSVRNPRYSTDAVNLRTLYRIVNNAVALAEEQAIAGEGEPGLGGIGAGSAPPTVALPNLFDSVQTYADTHPAELAASCLSSGGTWDYMDGLVVFLQGIDERVGFNGKRGDTADPSEDAVSYYHGILPPVSGSNDVYVIDVISGHCGPSPGPSWNNVTTPRAAGAWLPTR